MIAAVFLLGLHLHGVVDQIDAGWAWVEWEGCAFGFVPAEMLPPGVGEGDRVRLRVSRRGDPVEMPVEVAPRAGGVVHGFIQPTRARRARHRRCHESD